MFYQMVRELLRKTAMSSERSNKILVCVYHFAVG